MGTKFGSCEFEQVVHKNVLPAPDGYCESLAVAKTAKLLNFSSGFPTDMSDIQTLSRKNAPQKLRLLIVEDDAADLALIRTMLHPSQYELIEANTGTQGLALVGRDSIDCALVDYNLPDMYGTALFDSLRERVNDPQLPIILFTGQGDEFLAARAIQEGAADYLPKNGLSSFSLNRSVTNSVKHAKVGRDLANERIRVMDMNRELMRSNQEISAFYQTVSHELKTPLLAIRELTSITMDGVGGDINARQKEFLSESLSKCDSLAHMIDDLMDSARIQTGHLSFDLKRCQVSPLIRDCIALVDSSAQAEQITVECRLAENLPDIIGDKLRLGQLMNNLLANAMKFAGTAGRVCIESEQNDNGEIVIRVSDSGRGMNHRFRNKIFERIAQTRIEDVEFHNGMGIGLYLCANIAENHGGSIEVDSEVGAGSVFTVKLPLAEVFMTAQAV